MSHPSRTLASVLGLAVAGTAYVYAARPVTRPARTATPALAPLQRQVLDQYCVTCHNERLKTGGLVLEKIDLEQVSANAETLERVVRKLRTGQMPPAGAPRPDRPAPSAASARWE